MFKNNTQLFRSLELGVHHFIFYMMEDQT